jgi:hypothetical protein
MIRTPRAENERSAVQTVSPDGQACRSLCGAASRFLFQQPSTRGDTRAPSGQKTFSKNVSSGLNRRAFPVTIAPLALGLTPRNRTAAQRPNFPQRAGGLPEGSAILDMDHSVYFYTYSTIAQTLAGAFGFLVAAVVFRLQAISSRVDLFAEQVLKGSPSDSSKLREIQVTGDWNRLISLHAGENQFNPCLTREQNELLDLQFQQLRHGVLLLSRLKAALFSSLFLTGPVILFAIAAMPITHFFLDPDNALALAMLTACILGAAYCLWNYFRLMLHAFIN